MLKSAVGTILSLALVVLGLPIQAGDIPESFRAREAHEGVTIAARPIPDAPEAEEVFGKTAAPVRAGFLPVELIILNRRDEPIRVELGRIVVLEDDRKFEQVELEEIALALYPLPKLKDKPSTSPERIPTRMPKNKDKDLTKREEAAATLRSRQLRAATVNPGGQARGFLYFDLRRASLQLEKSIVYVPEVAVVPSGQALFYFEISLKPYTK
jgi:hypothetical protein